MKNTGILKIGSFLFFILFLSQVANGGPTLAGRQNIERPETYIFHQLYPGIGSPMGIAFDSNNTMYVASYYHIAKISNYRSANPTIEHPTEFQIGQVTDVVVTYLFGADGRRHKYLYAANCLDSRVRNYNFDNSTWSIFAPLPYPQKQFGKPNSLVVDPYGKILVLDYATQNNSMYYRIQKFNANGTLISSWSAGDDPAKSVFMNPKMAIDRTGKFLFVSDPLNHDVIKCTVGVGNNPGAKVAEFGSDALGLPAGLAVDAAGNIYVADENKNRIVKLSPTGSLLSAISEIKGPGSEQIYPKTFLNPKAVALDPYTGYLFVSDTGNNRVISFEIKRGFPISLPGASTSSTTTSTTIGRLMPGGTIIESFPIPTVTYAPASPTTTTYYGGPGNVLIPPSTTTSTYVPVPGGPTGAAPSAPTSSTTSTTMVP